MGTQQRSDRNVDLDSSVEYLQIFTMTLEFAACPRAICRPHAGDSGIKYKSGSSVGAARQVGDYLRDPQRQYAALIVYISVAFSKVS